MFPFEKRLQWHLSNRTIHLVQATENHLSTLTEPYQDTAGDRIASVRRWQKPRLALLLLLSPSIIATALATVARFLPFLDSVTGIIDRILGIAGGLSLVITLLFLLVTRYLGQLEADLTACLIIGLTPPEMLESATGE